MPQSPIHLSSDEPSALAWTFFVWAQWLATRTSRPGWIMTILLFSLTLGISLVRACRRGCGLGSRHYEQHVASLIGLALTVLIHGVRQPAVEDLQELHPALVRRQERLSRKRQTNSLGASKSRCIRRSTLGFFRSKFTKQWYTL